MVKRSPLSHNAGFVALNCPIMKKTPALNDAEINEIDELLAAVPAPFETVDAVILDGYLAGVIVQPVLLQAEDWLSPIFGTDGMPEPGWYQPVGRGLETKIAEKLAYLRQLDAAARK